MYPWRPLDEGYTSHTLAMSRLRPAVRQVFYLMANAYWEPLDFALPAAPAAEPGALLIDTSHRRMTSIQRRMRRLSSGPSIGLVRALL